MRTKQLSLTLCATFAVAALMLVAGCGGRSGKKSQLTTAEQLDAMIDYPLPTAYEVTNLINRSGAAYVIGITNATAKAENYLTEADKAVNLGVYGADLAYVTTYNMKQETMDYMKVLKKMVDDLQVSTNFNTELARNVENNIDNKDSLISIISQSFHDTYNFLINNGKDDISVLVLVGTWVEGLYLTTMVATTSVHNADMLQIVANQKSSLNTLVSLLDKHDQSPEVAQMRQLLEPIIRQYDDVKEKVSEEQAILISTTVEQIRNQLVK
ncbi:MAG: hypothetical protein LBU92_02090 [Prevotellaceae bacterium]|jgi:hypothetical protein|nr:hypothetical protein [Prevotellaceae bacterium]